MSTSPDNDYPYYRVQCERCTERWHLFPFRTLYLYARRNLAFAAARRSLGWCFACARPTVVEGHRSYVDVAREIDSVREERRSIRGVGLERFVNRVRTLFDAAHHEEMAFLDARELLLTRLADALRNRESAPRCLECGSASILALGDWGSLEEGRLPLTHPECGGGLTFFEAGCDASGEERTVLLDTEGLPYLNGKTLLHRSAAR